ncbi:MAG TPA: hypothetical protein VK720_05165 [Terracidiphilus sp.]|jgi:hypothetical protein|nr:hypothetical protein [Terracidiphilus sp.]
MTQNPPQIFSGIRPEQFTKLSEQARAKGIDMNGNAGTASKFGVEVSWDYSPETGELIFRCTKTPMFVNAATVYAKLKSVVEASLAAS